MTYFNKIREILSQVERDEKTSMEKAAHQMAHATEQGGIFHLFGSGHSSILAEEVLYRAGGLAPLRPILHEPIMFHNGAKHSSDLEKMSGYAETFMKEEDIRAEDVVLVISTSGRNPVPLDVALIARETGAYVIGLTSMEYQHLTSRHESNKLLYEVVDHTVNNHVPVGDAVMSHDHLDTKYGPVSTVIGSAIINQILSQTVEALVEKGIKPPVFKSGNVDGSTEHNVRLIEKYKSRNPLLS